MCVCVSYLHKYTAIYYNVLFILIYLLFTFRSQLLLDCCYDIPKK